jgi:hypothetical protein
LGKERKSVVEDVEKVAMINCIAQWYIAPKRKGEEK